MGSTVGMAAMVSLRWPTVVRDRRFVAGLILMVCALFGAVVFRGAEAAPVEVLAAAHDVPTGTSLSDADVVAVPVRVSDPVARHLIPAGTVVAGRSAAHHLAAGALLSDDDLGPAGPSRREVSVPVSAEHIPSGRIAPGDRVDVLSTSGDGPSASTTVVAAGVEVVAVTSQESLIGGGDSAAIAAVTISCDPATASAVVFASRAAKVDVVKAIG
jgi:Flp pilus assembly protein CpaB